MTSARKLRCAIYTRKSSEEGLEQDFNSLHAQREACEAYVRSQAGEGWTPHKGAYDDGGYSGGSMDRPGLKRLLQDIEAGHVDIVVVYKVDRLTRSLTDFARIVEAFDRNATSFVSVTQAFNTTTSMGRLTLNVLLSFAQFEREVTGERIRDKVAASKKKGMWMGGCPALGYDIQDRKLLINAAEAETVKDIFQRYIELGSVHALKADLDLRGVHTKAWTARSGRAYGGVSFSRGALFHILKSRLYLGQIVHKGEAYPGQHQGIVSAEVFDQVQVRLARQARARREAPTKVGQALLKGRIFDQDGHLMSPTLSYGKSGKAFRYYVSGPLQRGQALPSSADAVRRVSAPQLEALVEDRMRRLGIPDQLPARVEVRSHSVHLVLDEADLAAGHAGRASALRDLQHKLVDGDALTSDGEGAFRLAIAVRPVFRGGRTWLVGQTAHRGEGAARVDESLVAALRKAHRFAAEHNISPTRTSFEAAASPQNSYTRKMAQLVFLAPDIQKAILEGRQPMGLTAHHMLAAGIPISWSAQKVKFGFPVGDREFPFSR